MTPVEAVRTLRKAARREDDGALKSECNHLNRLLRFELTAVNQQFIHVLALRDWGYAEAAGRIMEVDYVDFPNAMGIIDYLVQQGLPVSVDSERPALGISYAGILSAELAFEQRLLAAIEATSLSSERACALLSAARAPRQAYAAWLESQLDGVVVDEPVKDALFAESFGVFAHLIALIEQTLVHAFVHRHQGDAESADAAWATCGAAMMQATEFVHLYTVHGALPLPNEIPSLQLAGQSAAAQEFDRGLIESCAREAAVAAKACDDTAIAELCRKIADYSLQLSAWTPGQAHPALGDNPAVFESFEGSLGRFVHTDR